jgi:hypothetical protein
MSRKEELQQKNSDLKEALQNQLNNLKGDFQKVGKSALVIGGSLVATYFLVDALTAKRKKKKKKTQVSEELEERTDKRQKRDNLLLSTAKEQAVIFLLGLAAQQLAAFLSELDSKDEEGNS